ncbi:MAG: DUF2125 domain-containing protein [Pseudomonadota bacterium]
MRRRLLFLLTLLLLAGGYTVGWFHLGSQLEDRVEKLIRDWQQRGWNVEYKDMQLAGFPFTLKIVLESPELAYKGIIKTWVEGDMRFGAALWRPTQIKSWAAGRHHITLSLLEDEIIFAQGEGFAASFFTMEQGTFQFSYEQLELSKEQGVFAKLGGLDVQAQYHEQEDVHDDLMNVQISLQDLTLPVLSEFPFGDNLQKLQLQTSLSGEIAGDTLHDRINSWYESDGTLEVAKLQLQWGPLEITAEGTTTVDEHLQPMGAFSAHVGGLDKTLAAFVKAGWLDEKVSRLVRLGLGFLTESLQGEAEASARYQLPLTVQSGRLFIGPVSVAKVPKVNWE